METNNLVTQRRDLLEVKVTIMESKGSEKSTKHLHLTAFVQLFYNVKIEWTKCEIAPRVLL